MFGVKKKFFFNYQFLAEYKIHRAAKKMKEGPKKQDDVRIRRKLK